MGTKPSLLDRGCQDRGAGSVPMGIDIHQDADLTIAAPGSGQVGTVPAQPCRWRPSEARVGKCRLAERSCVLENRGFTRASAHRVDTVRAGRGRLPRRRQCRAPSLVW